MKFSNLTTLLLTGVLLTTAHAGTTTVYHVKSQSKFMQTNPKGVLCTPIDVKDNNDCKIMSMRDDGRMADAGQMATLPERATAAPAPTSSAEQRADEAEKALKEQQAKILAEKCQAMRTNLAAYGTGGRIYETNANGERVYLNDQEISSKRQRTIDAIERECK
ncbi:hypothetical protein [Moraxella oblonga]|uniref:hypothetical protein n=1 Tax=Moraxella oblonga TaxID=200413 RepID=UPI0008348E63|nr:hypothetical protein [Moraxella oblonga]